MGHLLHARCWGHPTKIQVTVSSLQQLLVEATSAVGLGSDAHSTQGCLLPSQRSLEWGTGKRVSKPSGTWMPIMGLRSPLSQEGVLLTPY